MRNLLATFSVVMLLLVTAGAITAQSAKQILKDAEKALGSKKAVRSVESIRRSGLIIRVSDGLSGTFVMETSKPSFYRSKFDFRGFETETGFNGKSGWARDSREGLRTLTGNASEDFKAEAVFRNWQWIDYKKRKEKISGGGKAIVNNKYTDVVILTNPNAVAIKLYFDVRTKLLLREEMPNGDSVKVLDYSDYRPVNGVKVPFQMTTEKQDEKFTIRFDQILFNSEIPPSNFDFPSVRGAALPDIPQLLEDLKANEEKIDNILENYSYTEKTTKRELEDDGTLRVTESETYQLSFYKGNRIRRLIEKNGQPLSEDDQRKEDKEVEKRVEKIEKELAKQERKDAGQNSDGTPENEGQRISIAEVLRASQLQNPRRETLKGRNVIVFDFEPDPDFDFKNSKSFLKFFGKTAGVMWIDEEDKQVARLEAVLFDSYKVGGGILAKLRKGASFTLEKERLNDEIWLPSVADINLSVRVLLFGGVKVNQIVESSNYRKFKTDVEGAKVNQPSGIETENIPLK